MKVLVLTTSYPRNADDPAGRFVLDAVEHVRARGVEVEVVSPASFRHFGLAYGHGIVGNIRARPWLALLVPAFLWNFRRAAARRDADLVHAHWLAAGAVALTPAEAVRRAGVGHGRRARPPRAVARAAGAAPRAARHRGVAVARRRRARARCARRACRPERRRDSGSVGAPEEPPHVLYVGRLSAEKGVLELVEAARGLPLRVVGDGPLRGACPGAVGFVPPGELGRWYERAAVVAAPSRREGYGVVAREAMAWGGRSSRARSAGCRRGRRRRHRLLVLPGDDVRCVRRSSGCSATQSSVRGSARPRVRRRSASCRSMLPQLRSSTHMKRPLRSERERPPRHASLPTGRDRRAERTRSRRCIVS